MSIIKNLQWRYATKKFDANKSLLDEQLTILKEAFNLTALSYGLQTLKMVIIKDKTIRKSLIEFSYGQHQVYDASHLLILCVQNKVNKNDIDEHFNTIKTIRNTPDTILQPFKEQLESTISQMSESSRFNWVTKQAYIALGNLMTVCAIEEIDSCPMEGFIPDEYDRVLGLDKLGLNSVLLLPVGYRSKDDMFADLKKVRKPLSETIIEM